MSRSLDGETKVQGRRGRQEELMHFLTQLKKSEMKCDGVSQQ